MKYYIIFGPPGAGKGTQAVPLSKAFNLCHISTGSLLRAEITSETELGLQAKSLIEAGNFVPDEVVERMIKNRFDNARDVDGFLLDGFPRTISQAKDFEDMLTERGEEVTAVISLAIPESLIRERIKHRASIEGRADDADDNTITNRINTYHAKTEPLVRFYTEKGKYIEIDGDGGPGEEGIRRVTARILEALDQLTV